MTDAASRSPRERIWLSAEDGARVVMRPRKGWDMRLRVRAIKRAARSMGWGDEVEPRWEVAANV